MTAPYRHAEITPEDRIPFLKMGAYGAGGLANNLLAAGSDGMTIALNLDGKVAVITGATSGIGEATVDAFCEEGAHVVFCGRNAELGREVESRQPEGSALFVQADVLHESEIKPVKGDHVGTSDRMREMWKARDG